MRYITALTIAGSDSCGGAGLQADIKTMSALGVYATSVVTAVTSQNTRGVAGVQPMEARVVRSQMDAVFDDMVVDAVKIGMLANADVMQAVAEGLRKQRPHSIVVDPVMVSTSGHALMDDRAVARFVDDVLPLATLLTPNIPEAERLSGLRLACDDDFDRAATAITRLGCRAVLIKGGHLEGSEKMDRLYVDGRLTAVYRSPSVDTRNTHGTGCTLSSAIAALLARGETLTSAVGHAVDYVHEAICRARDIRQGAGHGPLCHDRLYQCADERHAVKRLDNVSLQFISHDNGQRSYVEGVELALRGGCRWIQLRMKDAADEQFVETAMKVRRLCSDYGATFVIDDRVHLVKTVGADGVHLGRNDMPVDDARELLGDECIIGGTANTTDDVERLFRAGADYIGCGPFRFTTTKKNLSPMLGLDGYKAIMAYMRQKGIALPLVAIGGILPPDVEAIMATGVSGVAVSGAVLNADDPAGETALFRRLVETGGGVSA